MMEQNTLNLIAQVASAMGASIVEPYEGNRDVKMILTKYGYMISFEKCRQKRGESPKIRFYLSRYVCEIMNKVGDYVIERGVDYSINCSASKSPEQIAKDIDRRLHPQCLTAFRKAIDVINIRDKKAEELELCIVRLENAWPKLAREDGRRFRDGQQLASSRYGENPAAFSSDIRIDSDYEVTIKLEQITMNMAVDLLSFINNYKPTIERQ